MWQAGFEPVAFAEKLRKIPEKLRSEWKLLNFSEVAVLETYMPDMRKRCWCGIFS